MKDRKFIIKGRPTKISMEEFRAMLYAASCVLEFHNKTTYENKYPIYVEIVDSIPGKTKTGGKIAGQADRKNRKIKLVGHYDLDDMFTHVIHEMIHIYIPMPEKYVEKSTSTLTNRLKPTISEIYDSLIEGIYERAAYIAHTKISYKPEGADYYDPEQYEPVEISDIGKKYRRNGTLVLVGVIAFMYLLRKNG